MTIDVSALTTTPGGATGPESGPSTNGQTAGGHAFDAVVATLIGPAPADPGAVPVPPLPGESGVPSSGGPVDPPATESAVAVATAALAAVPVDGSGTAAGPAPTAPPAAASGPLAAAPTAQPTNPIQSLTAQPTNPIQSPTAQPTVPVPAPTAAAPDRATAAGPHAAATGQPGAPTPSAPAATADVTMPTGPTPQAPPPQSPAPSAPGPASAPTAPAPMSPAPMTPAPTAPAVGSAVATPATVHGVSTDGLAAGPADLTRQQVAQAVATLTRRGDGEHRMTIRLDPEELGQLEVVVRSHRGGVDVTMAAARPEVVSSLLDASAELRRLLEDKGVAARDLDVRDLDQGSDRHGRSADDHRGGHRDNGSAGTHARLALDLPVPSGHRPGGATPDPDHAGALTGVDLHL